jgi:DNA polymerase elongation subunit (family B)
VSRSYSNVYYDWGQKAIHLWEFENGVRTYHKIPHLVEYYVDDKEKKSNITDPYGNHVTLKTSKDMWELKRLRESGIKMYESDIPEEVKFLQKRYVGEKLSPKYEEYNVCYLDIEVEVEGEFPDPMEAKYPINLITIKSSKKDDTYTFGLKRDFTPDNPKNKYARYETETDLLNAFIKIFRRLNFDIVTGWYISFDLNTIINRCEKLKIEKSLSPINKYRFDKRKQKWEIIGVTTLDYLDFYLDLKFAQEKQESYGLDHIGMIEVGEGKIGFEGSLNQLYKNDWSLFVKYNIQDVLLVEKIAKKKKFIETSLNLIHESLVPLDRIFGAVAVGEGAMLKFLHSKNMVMNDKKRTYSDDDIPGAYVESRKGVYRDVVSYDFTSLYPWLIILFNISPETLIVSQDFPDEEVFKHPLSETNGIYYKKKKGFIPELVLEKFNERVYFKNKKMEAKEKGDNALAEYYSQQEQTRKIFLNSLYGMMLCGAFHYFNVDMGISVTLGGQNLIKFVRDCVIEQYGKDIVAILDTDSVYADFSKVRAEKYSHISGADWAFEFDKVEFRPFIEKKIRSFFKKYDIDGIIDFKQECVISDMIVFGDKNYVCRVHAEEGKLKKKVELKERGFATRKSSYPKWCREKMREILNDFFDTKDKKFIVTKVRNLKKEFLKLEPEQIANPRKISDYDKWGKDGSYYVEHGLSYISRTPIHCKAAINFNYLIKKLNIPRAPIKSGEKIKYVIVKPDNEFGIQVLGYIGTIPEQIKEKVVVDYDEQFNVNLKNPLQNIFDVMDWQLMNLKSHSIDDLIK